MKPSEIAELATLMSRRGIELAEVETAAGRYRLVVDIASAAEAVAVPYLAVAGSFVTAPGPGLFRGTHPERGETEIKVGDEIAVDQLVGYLEAGEILLPIIAQVAGTVRDVLVAERELVGYGTRLFRLV
ncbi:acetyl-CoA carboxylase biotin carboxyl carrier protein subunit (plasmid) [Bosea sp. F3-2]|uniref:acetyl-CoA carboxylase biotin carboxyl carrier protein n=1 Tax=Bosea sp. F3-2 TaxID=2599640 RepID=UPI0011EF3493|nr:acetyl-CoA carboxylase biotin carboxyl carrier protein subunit [Bosea sp. F3-2]QEL27341.1 acetyl-CoA carboxylase biotin carboxyl carrier protein subunit [Bosea sp. F3-2]